MDQRGGLDFADGAVDGIPVSQVDRVSLPFAMTEREHLAAGVLPLQQLQQCRADKPAGSGYKDAMRQRTDHSREKVFAITQRLGGLE